MTPEQIRAAADQHAVVHEHKEAELLFALADVMEALTEIDRLWRGDGTSEVYDEVMNDMAHVARTALARVEALKP